MSTYYRKFHTFNNPSKETADALGTGYIDEKVQGRTGPIQSSFPEFHGPLGKAWPETFKNLDFPLSSDPLLGQSSGGYSYLSTVDPTNWERSHAGSAYYAPVADRPNLQMLTDTFVEKILLEQSDTDGIIAEGVNLRHNGVSQFCMARREVILCAGAIQSPQLLELSGIGSSKILKACGVQLIVDNPHVHRHPDSLRLLRNRLQFLPNQIQVPMSTTNDTRDLPTATELPAAESNEDAVKRSEGGAVQESPRSAHGLKVQSRS